MGLYKLHILQLNYDVRYKDQGGEGAAVSKGSGKEIRGEGCGSGTMNRNEIRIETEKRGACGCHEVCQKVSLAEPRVQAVLAHTDSSGTFGCCHRAATWAEVNWVKALPQAGDGEETLTPFHKLACEKKEAAGTACAFQGGTYEKGKIIPLVYLKYFTQTTKGIKLTFVKIQMVCIIE